MSSLPKSGLTRRQFLSTSAAAAVGVAGLSTLTAPGQDKEAKTAGENDGFGSFTVGLQSYTLRQFRQLDQVLSRIRELGLHFVEFYRDHVPLTSTEAQIQ